MILCSFGSNYPGKYKTVTISPIPWNVEGLLGPDSSWLLRLILHGIGFAGIRIWVIIGWALQDKYRIKKNRTCLELFSKKITCFVSSIWLKDCYSEHQENIEIKKKGHFQNGHFLPIDHSHSHISSFVIVRVRSFQHFCFPRLIASISAY